MYSGELLLDWRDFFNTLVSAVFVALRSGLLYATHFHPIWVVRSGTWGGKGCQVPGCHSQRWLGVDKAY